MHTGKVADYMLNIRIAVSRILILVLIIAFISILFGIFGEGISDIGSGFGEGISDIGSGENNFNKITINLYK